METNARKSAMHNAIPGPKKYDKERSLRVEQHAEDFEGFLVTEKRDQQLDALEGERLEKPVQVFSYDSKDDTRPLVCPDR